MSLPDPFSPEAGVTLQKASAPQVTIDYGAQLATAAPDIFLAIDALHKGQGNIDMVVASTAPLQIQPQFVESGSPLYNRQLVTALIMTVLANASAEGASFEHGNVNVKIFEALLEDLDAEGERIMFESNVYPADIFFVGRYTLLSSLIAQLRYPNTQSRWASACVLHLFETEGTDNFTKEVILRILLERVSCMRPHPWSLVYTLVELLRHNNPEEMECLERPELKAVLVPLLDRLRRKC